MTKEGDCLTLEIFFECEGAPEETALLERTAVACARAEGVENVRACLRLVDDEAIREANRDFRGVDRVTDVLSFPSLSYPRGTAKDNIKLLRREYDPQSGGYFLGDILVSLPQAKRQALEYGSGLSRELTYLTAHAMFHLMGYDHMEEGDKRVMRKKEEEALALMNDEMLYELACQALQNAYAPYSHFTVGACLRAENGETFTGCNIENASYGLTICAERAAVCNAVAHGQRAFTAIAVVGGSDVAWPCGACRQVLNEFSKDMRVICGKAGEGFTVVPLKELLPHSFGPQDLL